MAPRTRQQGRGRAHSNACVPALAALGSGIATVPCALRARPPLCCEAAPMLRAHPCRPAARQGPAYLDGLLALVLGLAAVEHGDAVVHVLQLAGHEVALRGAGWSAASGVQNALKRGRTGPVPPRPRREEWQALPRSAGSGMGQYKRRGPLPTAMLKRWYGAITAMLAGSPPAGNPPPSPPTPPTYPLTTHTHTHTQTRTNSTLTALHPIPPTWRLVLANTMMRWSSPIWLSSCSNARAFSFSLTT